MPKMKFFVLVLALVFFGKAHGQQQNLKTLPLDDLSAFRDQAGNWMIVSGVTMDPSVDVSHKPAPAPAAPVKGKKKKNETPVPPPPSAVSFTAGKGILLNINDDTKKDHLVTRMEHGDIELELDVMLPKGSNSGIYLQGRYEVQLFDSWGVRNATFSDIGGIYRNWEKEPGKIYSGKAPLVNAAKAPGLWQKLKISFRAPKFDNSGVKISNARFVSVELNGVIIHNNVEVPLPTGGPLENNETAKGPLMIQGDHGPVAFRNIRYKMMSEADFALSGLTYEVFHGRFGSTADYANQKPVLSGKTDELTSEVTDVDNEYGIRYKGQISVPATDRYTFTMMYTGGGKLIVNNRELFNNPTADSWQRDTASIRLEKGTYPFELYNFKTASWIPPRIALSVGSPTVYAKRLHSLNSFPPDDDPVSAIYINPTSQPRLLRAFLDFQGKRSERLTHTIGVGDPSGLNYAYDLSTGNLVVVWRGGFADATPMWHDRGDGSFLPLGAPLYLLSSPRISYLPSQDQAFPANQKESVRSKGYSIEEGTGRPVFTYMYQDLEVEDRIFPDNENTTISHEVRVKSGTRKEGLYYKLAEGSSIEQMPDGSYVVNDKQYYVRVGLGAKPFVREVNGKKELVVAMPQQALKYSIIW